MIGTYVNHILTVDREREADRLRRKQERYAAILEGLVPYIRSKGAEPDAFATAVLQAYIVGEPRVAHAIRMFTLDGTSERLDKIVSAMRADLGMEPLIDLAPTAGLLPPPKATETGSI